MRVSNSERQPDGGSAFIGIRVAPSVGGVRALALAAVQVILQGILSPTLAQTPSAEACEAQLAQEWIAENFSDADVVSGEFRGRVELDSPVWVRNASGSEARYAFSIKDEQEPFDRRVAFTNVRITNLRSKNKYGGGIKTHRSAPGMQLFLSNVRIEPGWPRWISYGNTNYDGLVLDGAEALYAQGLTISEWNADSAIDNKARISQLVRLGISGPGHRPLRYWRPGPHYLVHATIDKIGSQTLVWFDDCDGAVLYVYKSTFNGHERLLQDAVSCDSGSEPNIVYLVNDPRKTGGMHPMFGSCEIGD